MRPGFVLLLVAGLAVQLPGLSESIDLHVTQIAERARIVDIANAGDGSHRLFLVEQQGRVFVLDGGLELGQPFLDIRNKVRSSGNEQGLLSLAFAPDFQESGVFYVWYTNLFGATVLERYRVSQNPDAADPSSGEIVLDVPQPFENHNGGRLRFGPDGMLYLGLGDGGGAFDPQGNGQAGDTLLGKLIRVDVAAGNGTYAIPPDNPFAASGSVLGEIWALGLRNPWRISFDSATGDLFIADVGQNDTEEVNFQAANSNGGENYGWAIMEGSQCVVSGCAQSGLTLPVAEYGHGPHCSISGGEVYRGSAYPGLEGMYLYGDFCSGVIWGLSRNAGQWQLEQLLDSDLNITTFGLGEDGHVYVADRSTGVYLISDGPFNAGFVINAGLNDAWFNPATPGQGFFITVFPETGQMFLAWFTYDTARPPANVEANLGEPGHRWLTAFGLFSGHSAVLDIELTQGGVFNTGVPSPAQSPDGTILVEFTGCDSGTVTYDIDSASLQGVIPIQRIALDNVPLCEAFQQSILIR